MPEANLNMMLTTNVSNSNMLMFNLHIKNVSMLVNLACLTNAWLILIIEKVSIKGKGKIYIYIFVYFLLCYFNSHMAFLKRYNLYYLRNPHQKTEFSNWSVIVNLRDFSRIQDPLFKPTLTGCTCIFLCCFFLLWPLWCSCRCVSLWQD